MDEGHEDRPFAFGFVENERFSTDNRNDARLGGRLRKRWKRGKRAFALVLTEPEQHRGANDTLAGPGAVPWSDVEGALTNALHRKIRYVPASVVGYWRHLSKKGLPRGAIAVQTILHFLLRFGQGAAEDPTLEPLLGRPGRTVSEYIDDHAHLWAKTPN